MNTKEALDAISAAGSRSQIQVDISRAQKWPGPEDCGNAIRELVASAAEGAYITRDEVREVADILRDYWSDDHCEYASDLADEGNDTDGEGGSCDCRAHRAFRALDGISLEVDDG